MSLQKRCLGCTTKPNCSNRLGYYDKRNRCESCYQEHNKEKNKRSNLNYKKRVEEGRETKLDRKIRRFYNSQKWKDARTQAKEVWMYLDCIDCAMGIVEQYEKESDELQVHHVYGLRSDTKEAWDNSCNYEDNLILPVSRTNHMKIHKGLIELRVNRNGYCEGFYHQETGEYYSFPSSLDEVIERINKRVGIEWF